MSQEASCIAAERRIFPVEFKQALNLSFDGGEFGFGLWIVRRVNECAALKAIEKKKDVTHVGWLTTSSGQPLQVGSPSFGGDALVAWPVGHLPVGKAHWRTCYTKCCINKRRLLVTKRSRSFAGIDQAAGNSQSSHIDGFAFR